MILCMTFPIKLEIGFIFDLRYVPFILTALYGGYKMTFPLYLVLNVVRFLIGGDGVIQSMLFSSMIFMILPYFNEWFISLNSRKRVYSATLASFFTMVLYLSSLALQVEINMDFWTLTFYALTYYVVVTSFLTTFIERIFTNIEIRETVMNVEKINALSELSASVAHEIRNPLTVTHGFLQLLHQSKTIASEEKRYIEYSLQELQRAEKIVSEFLTLSKPQSEHTVFSNYKNEIEYVKNIIMPYANIYQVEIQLSFNNSLHKKYDKNQFHQCFINLLKNGIEAMQERGGILYIDIYDEKSNIIFKIKDTGSGMTKEEVRQLGKPFYSTKEKGTGMGMLLVYSTINKARGKIEVESEKGKGTTFLITIPV